MAGRELLDERTLRVGQLGRDVHVDMGDEIAALDPTPNADFLDVSRVDWFYYDVRYVCENGLMNGTSRNRFSPYGTVTRRPCPITRCPLCAGPAAQASCKAQTASSTLPASPPAPSSQPCCTGI